MSPTLEPLLADAFRSIDVDPSTLRSVSRGIYSDGTTSYFTKVSSSLPQLRAEHASLEALTATAPAGFVPRPFALMEENGKGAMISEYFNLGGAKDQREMGLKLAEMHQAPPKERWEEVGYTGKFGFSMLTFCGVTEQDNTWSDSWKEFYVERRSGDMIRRIGDGSLTQEWEKLKDRAIPLLLDDFEPKPEPVIIHGDLWSGNVASNKDTGSPVIFDPSSCWGHNEYELGICHMFGGFAKEFFDAYHSVHPRSEPHHDQRIKLYELYHHLNHTLMFGGGYKSGALGIMRGLVAYAEGQ